MSRRRSLEKAGILTPAIIPLRDQKRTVTIAGIWPRDSEGGTTHFVLDESPDWTGTRIQRITADPSQVAPESAESAARFRND